MRYVAVLGLAKDDTTSEVVFNYFDDYLVSMGEPLTSKSWTLFQLNKFFKKIIDNHKKLSSSVSDKYHKQPTLFVDSGGFQIIVGYVVKKRIIEYIDSYHYILKKYHGNMPYIFSLDVNFPNATKNELLKYNKYSISKSIETLNKYPELKDKQIFVVQSRTVEMFNIWKKLMHDENVYQNYKRYSFGGLVGLKKETNAKFSHPIPFTFWLLQKIKENNSEITHIHYLGQSSKLMIFTIVFLENYLKKKYNIDIEFTMDSSELMRFTRLDQKLPLLCKIGEERHDYKFIKELQDIEYLCNNCLHDVDIKKAQKGNIENHTYVDFLCQNIDGFIDLSHHLLDDLTIKEMDDMLNYNIDDIKKLHPFLLQGRFALEVKNNFKNIKLFSELYEKNDSKTMEDELNKILKSYEN